MFKCTHPAGRLGVERAETREQIDDEFDHVTYHLFCYGCRKPVEIRYEQLRISVAEFMARPG